MYNIVKSENPPSLIKDLHLSEKALNFLSICFIRDFRYRPNVVELLNTDFLDGHINLEKKIDLVEPSILDISVTRKKPMG